MVLEVRLIETNSLDELLEWDIGSGDKGIEAPLRSLIQPPTDSRFRAHW